MLPQDSPAERTAALASPAVPSTNPRKNLKKSPASCGAILMWSGIHCQHQVEESNGTNYSVQKILYPY